MFQILDLVGWKRKSELLAARRHKRKRNEEHLAARAPAFAWCVCGVPPRLERARRRGVWLGASGPSRRRSFKDMKTE